MMGTKTRSFSPLPRDVSLEDLVPQDNFYLRLEARLDLSFVREFVASLYARGDRPSVDPVVYCRSRTCYPTPRSGLPREAIVRTSLVRTSQNSVKPKFAE